MRYKLGIALIEPDFDRHRIIELMKLRGGHIKSLKHDKKKEVEKEIKEQ